MALAHASSYRIPAEPHRACRKNDDEQNIVIHGSHHVSVEERMESTGHSAARAIEAGRRFEGASGKQVGLVWIDNANGDTSGERNAAGDRHARVDATSTRGVRLNRGTCLIRRIDGVRQHVGKCRADIVTNCCRCLW